MKRTTISLPDKLAELVEHEARRRGTSVSELARQALIAHLSAEAEGRRKLPFAALGRSGHRTTARDFEAIIAQEWSAADGR